MSLIILWLRTSRCMLSMMILASPTADPLTKSKKSWTSSSKSTFQATSNSKIVLKTASFQESSILSRELNSFTRTRFWITWHRRSWFRISSIFLTIRDMLSHHGEIYSSLEDSTHRQMNSWPRLTSWMSTDLYSSPWMACSTQEQITWYTSSRTASTSSEEWATETTRMEVGPSFKVSTPVSSTQSPAKSG